MDRLAITWTADDIIAYFDVTRVDAEEALRVVHRNLDCNNGITWDTLEDALDCVGALRC